METLNFGTADVPVTGRGGRPAEPNPFSDIFPTSENQARTLTLKGSAESNQKTITNLTGKARRAADQLDTPMSARVAVTEEGTGKNVQTVIAFWTVPKITRKRNTDATDAE